MFFLMRFAAQIVEQVMSSLMQQFNVVQEMVRQPMQTMVNSMVDPVWKGDGADQFKEEVSSLVIPGVGQVSAHITNLHRNFQRGSDIINQADQAVQQMAQSVGDVFSAIF